jgi:hypothetical protein
MMPHAPQVDGSAQETRLAEGGVLVEAKLEEEDIDGRARRCRVPEARELPFARKAHPDGLHTFVLVKQACQLSKSFSLANSSNF